MSKEQDNQNVENSLALLDQAALLKNANQSMKDLHQATEMEVDASLDLLKSKKELTDAVELETDTSLDLSGSKEKLNKAVSTEIDVTKKSVDVSDDLNYTKSEQARLEKVKLDNLARQLEIEKKSGIVDYNRLDSELHQKLAESLQRRLEQEKIKQKADEEALKRQQESENHQEDADFEDEKIEQKIIRQKKSLFKRLVDMTDYKKSSSFTGRLAMGAASLGTSELMNLINKGIDQIPGAGAIKATGGFIRDQWVGSRNNKEKQSRFVRQNKTQPEPIRLPESESKKQKADSDNKRKTGEGVTEIGKKVERVITFLKKLSEMMLFMGIFKTLFGMLGSVLSGLGGIIGTALTGALTALGLGGILTSILGVLKSGLAGIANGLGMKLPKSIFGETESPKKDTPKSKTPQKTPTTQTKTDRLAETSKKPPTTSSTGAPKVSESLEKKILAKRTLKAGVSGASKMVAPIAGVLTAAEIFDYLETASMQSDLTESERKEVNELREKYSSYEDSAGHNRPPVSKNGELNLYPNQNNDPRLEEENQRRYKMVMEDKGLEATEEGFRALQKATDDKQKAEQQRYAGYTQANQNLSSASSVTNVNNSISEGYRRQFGFNPTENSSRDRYSRGENR